MNASFCIACAPSITFLRGQKAEEEKKDLSRWFDLIFLLLKRNQEHLLLRSKVLCYSVFFFFFFPFRFLFFSYCIFSLPYPICFRIHDKENYYREYFFFFSNKDLFVSEPNLLYFYGILCLQYYFGGIVLSFLFIIWVIAFWMFFRIILLYCAWWQ